MTNVLPSFWQKTLQSFTGKQVHIVQNDGTVLRGWLEEIGVSSVRVKPSNTLVAYSDLREVTEARP